MPHDKLSLKLYDNILVDNLQMGGGLMGVEVIVSRASALANLLGRLVLPHYRLATTTVTGIPMKVCEIVKFNAFKQKRTLPTVSIPITIRLIEIQDADMRMASLKLRIRVPFPSKILFKLMFRTDKLINASVKRT